jgi:predicted  nucleic acid-binding Zn-ribbon protein
MNEAATKTDIKQLQTNLVQLEGRIKGHFDDLTALMSKFATDVDIRFDRIETKQLQHDVELCKLNKKYDHLVSTIDGFVGRIDRYETELSARDHKIERLERWIQQIATKNKITLV